MGISYSSCPVETRTNETFVEYVHVGGVRQRMEFTKQITWLRQSESKVMFLHGGEVLKEGSLFTDHYGYLTSMELDSPTPEELAAHFAVDRVSSMEIQVETTVFLRPVMETDETKRVNAGKKENTKSQYEEVPRGWRQEVSTNRETRWPRVEDRELGLGVTWSSKNTPEANAAALRAFRKKWAVKDSCNVDLAIPNRKAG